MSETFPSPFEKLLFRAALAMTVLSALTVGFFLHGGVHGLYMDDYSEKAWAFDFARATWKLNFIPLSHIRSLAHILIANIANAIPTYEFPVRIAIVAVHFLNVLLLGKLAHRLSGSFLVGTIASAYFIFPIVANDAVLWFSTSIANTISLSLLLIGFHCFLSCRSLRKDRLLFCCGASSWTLMVLFYEPGIFSLLLLPVLVVMTHPGRTPVNRRISIWALGASYFPIGMYMLLVERRAPEFAARGGATLDPAFILSHRVPDVFRAVAWLLTDWGLFGPLREAFTVGTREWLSMPFGWAILSVFVASLILVAILFPSRRDGPLDSRRLMGLLLIAIAWMILGMVPTVLVKSQEVATRALYTPFAGFSLGAAAISGLVLQILMRGRETLWRAPNNAHKDYLIPAILSMTGAVVMLCSLTMAGVVRTYQLRWDLDKRQVDALGQLIPALSRVEPVWLLPVTLDERTVGKAGGPEGKLDLYLAGVFETPWSARDAVRLRFGDRNLMAVTANRWAPLRVTSVNTQESRLSTVTIQDATIPVEHLLAFTYENGQAILLNPIEINRPSGGSPTVIDLPLAAQFAGHVQTQPAHLKLDRSN